MEALERSYQRNNFPTKHHIIHHELEWSSRPEYRQLRENPRLIFEVGRLDHDDIHKMIPPVPLIGIHGIMRVNKLFRPEGDMLRDISHLQSCIDKTFRDQRFFESDRILGHAAIEALRIQRQILKQYI